MTTSAARRVDSIDELERAGDYCLGQIEHLGEVRPQLWFLLPLHEGATRFDRPTVGSGLHGISSPPWTFRECDDGSIEVRASILCKSGVEGAEGYFHGWLDEGNIWRY